MNFHHIPRRSPYEPLLIGPHTGTMFRMHTPEEARALFNKTDFRMGATDADFLTLVKNIAERRARGEQVPGEDAVKALTDDWKKLLDRWKFRAVAFRARLAVLDKTFPLNVPAALSQSEDLFKEIALYLSPEPNDFVRGEWPDVAHRIEMLQGHLIDLSKEPQEQTPDFDFEAFKKSNEILKSVALQTAESNKDLEDLKTLVKWGMIGFGSLFLFVTFYPEIRSAMWATRAAVSRRKK